MIQVSEFTLFFAFRYALGRMSTAPSIVGDDIIRLADTLKESTKQGMIDEIGKAIAEGSAGWECDVDNWQKVAGRLGQAYTVAVNYEGKQSTYTCYKVGERYYRPDMIRFVAHEHITSITPIPQ